MVFPPPSSVNNPTYNECKCVRCLHLIKCSFNYCMPSCLLQGGMHASYNASLLLKIPHYRAEYKNKTTCRGCHVLWACRSAIFGTQHLVRRSPSQTLLGWETNDEAMMHSTNSNSKWMKRKTRRHASGATGRSASETNERLSQPQWTRSTITFI